MSTHSTNTNATFTHQGGSASKMPFGALHFSEESLIENVRKQINGTIAPEASFMPPPAMSAAISNLNEESKDPAVHKKVSASQSSAGSRDVLDHMARLDFNVDTQKGGTLISFHLEY